MLNEADLLPSLLQKTTIYQQYKAVEINWINQQLKNLGIKNSPPFLRGAGGDQPC